MANKLPTNTKLTEVQSVEVTVRGEKFVLRQATLADLDFFNTTDFDDATNMISRTIKMFAHLMNDYDETYEERVKFISSMNITKLADFKELDQAIQKAGLMTGDDQEETELDGNGKPLPKKKQ